jgi:MFS family permease
MATLIDLNTNPDERTLRRFGVIALLVFGALALCAFRDAGPFAFGLGRARVPVAFGLGTVAAAAGLFSAVSPNLNRALYLGLAHLTYPLGLLVSYAVIAVLFYGVFTPAGVLLRLLGKDPLERTLERDRASYWTATRGPRSKRSYFRQF